MGLFTYNHALLYKTESNFYLKVFLNLFDKVICVCWKQVCIVLLE